MIHLQTGENPNEICQVTVEMGTPEFRAAQIPVVSLGEYVLEHKNYRVRGKLYDDLPFDGKSACGNLFRRDKRDFSGRDRKGVRISSEISGEGKYRVLSCDCEKPDGDPCVGAQR